MFASECVYVMQCVCVWMMMGWMSSILFSTTTGADQVLYQDRQLLQQALEQELQQRLAVTWDCLIQQHLICTVSLISHYANHVLI